MQSALKPEVPVVSQYPAVQRQSVAIEPVDSVVVEPAGEPVPPHAEQDAAFAALKVPIGQGLQVVDPALEYVPAGHCVQLEISANPTVALYVPAAQG